MRALLVAVMLMGCGDGDSSREAPDAAVISDAPAPTCQIEDGTCPDLGNGPTLPYRCTDGENPALRNDTLRCIDPTGRGGSDFCCCVERYPGQVWPCNG